jgi:hypothetical protein
MSDRGLLIGSVLVVLAPFAIAFGGYFVSEWRRRRRIRLRAHTLSRAEYEDFVADRVQHDHR